MSRFQSRGLSLLVYKPSIVSSVIDPKGSFLGEFGEDINSWQHETNTSEGYKTATFTISDRLQNLNSWIAEGLGRHIECYSPSSTLIWEGFVNKISANIGPLAITRGPLFDIGNRVSVIYSPILDATTDPPIVGSETTTIITEDTNSQNKYGIIEKVLSGGTRFQDDAEQVRDTYLAETSEPETGKDFSSGGQGFPSITVECEGYYKWLDAYAYNQTASIVSTTVSAKMAAVFGADPNSILSTNYGRVTTNGVLVPSYENDSRMALTIIKDMVAIGDINDSRYIFGVFESREVVYEPIPTEISYEQGLYSRSQDITVFRDGAIVEPWAVMAGKFIFYKDFLVGRAEQITDLRLDPRTQFIESVTYTLPDTVQLAGNKFSTLPQKLAKLGLGGI
jgi:hypothetical protein